MPPVQTTSFVSLVTRRHGNEKHKSICARDTCGARLIALPAAAATPTAANIDLETIADGQAGKLYNSSFARKAPAAIAPARRKTTVGRRHGRSTSAIATIAVVASVPVPAGNSLALVKPAAITTAAAVSPCGPIGRLSVPYTGCLASAAATTTARAIKIQTLETECPTTTAATARGSANDQQTM